MQKKLFLIIVIIFLSANFIFAQIDPNALGYYNDALRFSNTNYGGSARFQGLAGATTAVGADIGALNSNPAGLGLFSQSEFTFTPSLNIANNQSNYSLADDKNQTQTAESKVTGNLNNFGIVIYTGKDEVEGGTWRGGSFGISVSRVNNFQNRISYQGRNNVSSKTDFYVESANGIRAGDLENLDLLNLEYQRMAYYAYLVNPIDILENGNTDPENTGYYSFALGEDGSLLGAADQSEIINTRGSQYQWNFSYGGNFADKIFFGANLSLVTLNYLQDRIYKEKINFDANTNQLFPALESFSELNENSQRGTGFNFSFGMIAKPTDMVRVGVSVVSPTFYSIKEEFSTTFDSNIYFGNGGLDSFSESTLPGEFSYRLTTPWRFNAGIAVFAGKYGFVSIDGEYVAYDGMKLNNTDDNSLFDADNRTIRNALQPTLNLRIGAEARLSYFRVRGGFGVQGDPYKDIDDLDRKIFNFTGGVGIRKKDFYADLGVVYSTYQSYYQPYILNDINVSGTEPLIQTKNNFIQAVITAGIYF